MRVTFSRCLNHNCGRNTGTELRGTDWISRKVIASLNNYLKTNWWWESHPFKVVRHQCMWYGLLSWWVTNWWSPKYHVAHITPLWIYKRLMVSHNLYPNQHQKVFGSLATRHQQPWKKPKSVTGAITDEQNADNSNALPPSSMIIAKRKRKQKTTNKTNVYIKKWIFTL